MHRADGDRVAFAQRRFRNGLAVVVGAVFGADIAEDHGAVAGFDATVAARYRRHGNAQVTGAIAADENRRTGRRDRPSLTARCEHHQPQTFDGGDDRRFSRRGGLPGCYRLFTQQRALAVKPTATAFEVGGDHRDALTLIIKFSRLLIKLLLKCDKLITLRFHRPAVFLDLRLHCGELRLAIGFNLLAGRRELGPLTIQVRLVALERGIAFVEVTHALVDFRLLFSDVVDAFIQHRAIGGQTRRVGLELLLPFGELGEHVLVICTLLIKLVCITLKLGTLLIQGFSFAGQLVTLIFQHPDRPGVVPALALKVRLIPIKTLAVLPETLLLMGQLTLAGFEFLLHLLERSHVDLNIRRRSGTGLGDLTTSLFHRGAQGRKATAAMGDRSSTLIDLRLATGQLFFPVAGDRAAVLDFGFITRKLPHSTVKRFGEFGMVGGRVALRWSFGGFGGGLIERRHLKLHHGVQIAASIGFIEQPRPTQQQLLAAAHTRGDVQLDFAFERAGPYAPAVARHIGRHRHIEIQVEPVTPQTRMRANVHQENQVAGMVAGLIPHTEPADAEQCAFVDTAWQVDVDLIGPAGRDAFDGDLPTERCLVKADLEHLDDVIVARRCGFEHVQQCTVVAAAKLRLTEHVESLLDMAQGARVDIATRTALAKATKATGLGVVSMFDSRSITPTVDLQNGVIIT